jgi:phytoene dehydrogenase-like protein
VKQVKSAIIIGSGVGGLGAACLLAKAGWQVTVLEKNDLLGGRVGTFTAEGFTFDTGPSWFLMPAKETRTKLQSFL